MTTESHYIPGMCNINPKEIARRRNTGHLGLALTLILFALFAIIDISPWFQAIIFIPAFIAATGYLQARNKFCVGYAGAKQHHADDGNIIDITEESALAADKAKAQKITIQAISLALIATIVISLLLSL